MANQLGIPPADAIPTKKNDGATTCTWIMMFRDEAQQKDFMQFKTKLLGKQFSSYYLASFVTVLIVLFWIMIMTMVPSAYNIATMLFCFIVLLPLLWSLTVIKQSVPSELLHQYATYCYYAENALMLSGALLPGLQFIGRLLSGPCKSPIWFFDMWTCAHSLPCRGIPGDMATLVMFMPVLCSSTLPSIAGKYVIIVYLFAIAIIVWSVVELKAILAIPWILTAFSIAVALNCINSWNQIQLYKYFVQILQHKREEDALRLADGMRNLIGKVAHDFTTPLVAFNNGMEVMQQSLKQLDAQRDTTRDEKSDAGSDRDTQVGYGHSADYHAECSLASTSADSKELGYSSSCADKHPSRMHPALLQDGLVQEVYSSLEGMQQSQVQLMMIIHRCIDYHKISYGLPLVPKYAPIRVAQLADMLLDYVRKTYEEGMLKVEHADILSYTIETDVGWIQENLLCLVSNAIRFSLPSSTPVLLRIMCCKKQYDIETSTYHLLNQAQDVDRSGREDEAMEMIKFEIEDFGVGIEQAACSSLFLAPEGNADRSMGGAGLGLYCLAERVKALQGMYGVQVKGRAAMIDEAERSTPSRKDKLHWGGGVERACSPTPSNDGIRGTGCISWFAVPYFEQPNLQQHLQISLLGHNMIEANAPGERDIEQGKQQEDVVLHVRFDDAESKGEQQNYSPDSNHSSLLSKQVSPNSVAAPIDHTSAHTIASASTRAMPALCVLIVDDSPLILKMLKMMLMKHGHKVLTTTNGYEALDMLRKSVVASSQKKKVSMLQEQNADIAGEVALRDQQATEAETEKAMQVSAEAAHIDVALVDIQMPVISGLQVLRAYFSYLVELGVDAKGVAVGGVEQQLDTQGATCSSVTPSYPSSSYRLPMMIAMSANTDHVTMQDAYTAGAAYFLQKPFDIHSFYAALAKAADKHDA